MFNVKQIISYIYIIDNKKQGKKYNLQKLCKRGIIINDYCKKGDKMKRNIIINEFDNPARNFGAILKDLEQISEKRGIPVQEAIRLFIFDLQNLTKEDYQKNINEISINGGISSNLKNNLITYLNKAKKRYNQLERKTGERKKRDTKKQELEEIWSVVEDEIVSGKKGKARRDFIKDLSLKISEGTVYTELTRPQKSYVLKKLRELEREENKRKEKDEQDREREISKKWGAIVETVEREARKTGKNKLEIWDTIAESILGEEGEMKLNINVPETMKPKISSLIEEQEKIEGVEYFEDVKNYTQNFEFLTGFRGITFAAHGHRKFSKPEYSRMFESLIAKLRKSESAEYSETEEKFLKRVLSKKLVNTYYGKKIVEERIDKIEKDNTKNIRRSFTR